MVIDRLNLASCSAKFAAQELRSELKNTVFYLDPVHKIEKSIKLLEESIELLNAYKRRQKDSK